MKEIRDMLCTVAVGLEELVSETVFVGGATVILYDNKRTEEEQRPTQDVDCVIEITSRKLYNELEEKLRKKGFKHDQRQGAPVCRWIFNGVTTDIVPSKPEIIGFSNGWYPEGVANSIWYELTKKIKIRIFTPVFFLATKIEALKDRGMSDIRLSRDFEDIVAIFDFQNDMDEFIFKADGPLRNFLRNEIKVLVKHHQIEEAIYANMPPRYREKEAPDVFEKMKFIASLK